MSVEALTWAFKTSIKPATRKLVLIALADAANDNMICWPSIDALEQKTSLDRKTIVAAIADLEAWGLLRDTGRRAGKTRQIPVYVVNANNAVYGTIPALNSTDFGNDTGNGNDTVFDVETVPFFPGNSTENGTRNPKGTQREPSHSACAQGGDSDAGKAKPKSAPPSRSDSGTGDSVLRRGTRVPDDFTYRAEDAEWAKQTFPWLTDANLDFITGEFRDWWGALADTKESRKANWFLTWRNRVRDVAQKYQKTGNHTDRYPSRDTGNYATGPKLQDLTGIGGDKPIRSFPARRPSEVRQ